MKGRKATARRLPFGDIDKARVQVEFNRKDKSDQHAKNENDENEMEEEA